MVHRTPDERRRIPVSAATFDTLARSRRYLVWRGVIALVFGLLVVAWPSMPLLGLTMLFTGYAFGDGVLALSMAVQREPREHRWLFILDGFVGLTAGVTVVVWPLVTLPMLVIVAALRAIVSGVAQVIASAKLGFESPTVMIYGFAGLLSVSIGILMGIYPRMSQVVFVALLGASAFAFGALMFAAGFRLRKLRRTVPVRPERRAQATAH